MKKSASLQLGLFDPPAPPRTRVTLYQGDCLEVMPKLEPQSVQMVFADLPYSTQKGKKYTDNVWDTPIDLSLFWQTTCKVLICRGWTILTASLALSAALHRSNQKQFRHDLIWHKVGCATGFLNAKKAPLRAHEHILVFADGQGTYNPQMTPGKAYTVRGLRRGQNYNGQGKGKTYTDKRINLGTRFPRSVVEIKRVGGSRYHPTQKPIALLEWLIQTYTNKGDTILDPTAGSGTTVIAAMRTGRHCIAIEKDPDYFEVMRKRVAEERERLGQ